MTKTSTAAWSATAVAERSDKFTYVLDPKSGADIWMKSPADSRGRPIFPDLHINVDWAEDLILELSLAIEEKRKDEAGQHPGQG